VCRYAVGLSNYGPKQLRRIHKYMSVRGVPIATLQVQYHLLSRFPGRVLCSFA
jgi:pyridoxine 4-dehydrogenase